MKQSQVEHILEQMRYQDVDWRNVHIGRVVQHMNEREHLISEIVGVFNELYDIAIDSGKVGKVLDDKYHKLLKEV